MSDPKPPEPLLRDEHIADELRAVLDARSEHEPSPADLSRLGARLAAALPPGTLPPAAAPGQPPPASPAGAPPVSLLSSGAAKIVLGVALVGILGGGIWLARDAGSADSPAPAPSASVEAPEASFEAPPPASVVTAPPLVATPSTASIARPPASLAGGSPRPSSVANVVAPPEATLLSRAHQELLRGAPDKALATTTEHERAYGERGALSQEREVIAIEALVALGRRDDARLRAARFHQRHPGSSHGGRIDRLVGAP